MQNLFIAGGIAWAANQFVAPQLPAQLKLGQYDLRGLVAIVGGLWLAGQITGGKSGS